MNSLICVFFDGMIGRKNDYKGATNMDLKEKALALHKQWNGKLSTEAKSPVNPGKIYQSHTLRALQSM